MSEDKRLHLGLATIGSLVDLGTNPAHGQELQRLVRNFKTGNLLTSFTATVELEDFLTNLTVLSKWPGTDLVVWSAELENVVRSMVADSQTVDSVLHQPAITQSHLNPALEANWVAPLSSHQERDLKRLIQLKHGANFSVPGAGKTRTTLAIFSHLRNRGDAKVALIIGPKSSFSAWREENLKCFRVPLEIRQWGEGNELTSDILLINYEMLNSNLNSLGHWLRSHDSLLILDEAHRMKLGADGVYGSACLALGPLAKNRLILSGTPAPNGTTDLENLFSFVWPGFGKQKVSNAVRGGNLANASHLLQPLFTRTTKSDLSLPPISFRKVPISLTPLHSEIYSALLGHFSSRVRTSQDDFASIGRIMMYMIMAATSPALLTLGSSRYDPLDFRVPPLPIPRESELFDLLQDLPDYELSAKYQEVIALVQKNASHGKKTLIWSSFVRNLTTLERILNQYKPAVVHGSSKNREYEIKRFRNDADCLVLLTNPATLGEGISLHQVCHEAVYLDRDFSAGRFQQSVDRIHRLGLDSDQETTVTILESQGTIDELISSRLNEKIEFLGQVLNDPNVRALTDLEEIAESGPALDRKDLRSIIEHFDAHSAS